MKPFLWNIFLAAIWSSVGGEITPVTLLTGFVFGYLVLWFTWPVIAGETGYFGKVRLSLGLLAFFAWEMFHAGLRVAWAVVNPAYKMQPGILSIPLDDLTDGEITLLASIISLTPGTLSLEVSRDRSKLYIHAMFLDDADEIRRSIKGGYERRIKEIFR